MTKATRQRGPAECREFKDSPIMTLKEAAGFMRISEQTIRHYAVIGTIPGRQIGTSWRFLRSALEEFTRGTKKPSTEADDTRGLKKALPEAAQA